jgi:hypothetical protein
MMHDNMSFSVVLYALTEVIPMRISLERYHAGSDRSAQAFVHLILFTSLLLQDAT